MKTLIEKCPSRINGCINGFDRIMFNGLFMPLLISYEAIFLKGLNSDGQFFHGRGLLVMAILFLLARVAYFQENAKKP